MQKYNVADLPAEEVVLETRTFAIEGMTCDNCVRKIQKILGEAKGVKTFEVDRKAARANVTFDNTKTDVPEIFAALRKGGYSARPFADEDAPTQRR
jgi:copper ion binding protein